MAFPGTCSALCVLLILLVAPTTAHPSATPHCTDRRPPPSERRFVSQAVDDFITSLVAELEQANRTELACIFANALPNTLDTTVLQTARADDETSFIITGDINAMWLRDSMNQVLPYMRFASKDPALRTMLAGLVRSQTAQILSDPYANAHSLPDIAGPSPHTADSTTFPGFGPSRIDAMVPGIFERKYELDSLCAFLKLSRSYYDHTGDFTPFNGTAAAPWLDAVQQVLAVMRAMQASSEDDRRAPGGPAYQFQREAKEPTDTLLHGTGHPAASTGMVRSAFRPSDDATTFPFLVPANAMAAVELAAVAGLLEELGGPAAAQLAAEARSLAGEIRAGIAAHAVFPRGAGGGGERQLAYEVDGYGNAYFADDANVPSLLSLPYLGFLREDDPLYVATRRTVWSPRNPWFFAGRAGEGIGGPHAGPGSIWPMSITMYALTASEDSEVEACLAALVASSAGTGLMHESFSMNDAGTFTRPWFAWANALFGELVIRVAEERPHLLGLRGGGGPRRARPRGATGSSIAYDVYNVYEVDDSDDGYAMS